MTRHDNRQPRERVAIGSNPERNRAHNRRVVLEVVRSCMAISAAPKSPGARI